MNLALGLRQIFSYLLPGAISIIVVGASALIAFPSVWLASSNGNLWQALDNGLGRATVFGSLVFVMLSIAIGLVGSSWFSLTLQLTLRWHGDPRVESLSILPEELQCIISSGAKEEPILGITLFYDFWSMVKLKVESHLEYSLFSVYALNFCSRVLGAVVLAMAIFLLRLCIGFFQGDPVSSVAALSWLALALVAILLLWCMRYFFTLYCYFAISMFTAVYELDLTREQRNRMRDRAKFLVERVSDAPRNRKGTVGYLYDPYRWRGRYRLNGTAGAAD